MTSSNQLFYNFQGRIRMPACRNTEKYNFTHNMPPQLMRSSIVIFIIFLPQKDTIVILSNVDMEHYKLMNCMVKCQNSWYKYHILATFKLYSQLLLSKWTPLNGKKKHPLNVFRTTTITSLHSGRSNELHYSMVFPLFVKVVLFFYRSLSFFVLLKHLCSIFYFNSQLVNSCLLRKFYV